MTRTLPLTSPFPHEAPVIHIASESAFSQAVATAEKPLLVLFAAAGLAASREPAAADVGPTIDVLRVDADALPSVARRYGITALPTMALIVAGQIVARRIGGVSGMDLVNWLEGALT